uniref:Uncharacterized protein n=1 Tax=Oryza barthii TaxID=65489 RepID=A0A0D3F2D4_9ORYZ
MGYCPTMVHPKFGGNSALELIIAKHNLLESRLVMELRLPMQGGIEPLSPLELMFSAMTRIWVCVLLHETPCQLQKSRDVLLQDLKALWDQRFET